MTSKVLSMESSQFINALSVGNSGIKQGLNGLKITVIRRFYGEFKKSNGSVKPKSPNPVHKKANMVSEVDKDTTTVKERSASTERGQSLSLMDSIKAKLRPIKAISDFMRSGLMLMKDDVKYFLDTNKNYKTGELPINDYFKTKQIKSDLKKFFGFSFFIIVPGSTGLLPIYLALLPRSIPTQFQHQEYRKLNSEFKNARYLRARAALQKKLLGFDRLKRLLESSNKKLNSTKANNVNSSLENLITEFRENWASQYQSELSFDSLDNSEREALLNFLCLDFTSGRHIGNVFVNLKQYIRYFKMIYRKEDPHKLQFVDWTPKSQLVNDIRAKVMKQQFDRLKQRIQEEDMLIDQKSKNDLSKIEPNFADIVLRQRGINPEDSASVAQKQRIYLRLVDEDFEVRVWAMALCDMYFRPSKWIFCWSEFKEKKFASLNRFQ